jgi:rhodanese-related sulfurtransferase
LFGIVVNSANPNGLPLLKSDAGIDPKQPVKAAGQPDVKTTDTKSNTVTNTEKITNTNTHLLSLIEEAKKKEDIFTEIHLKEAKAYFDSGKAVFVDTRPEFKYIESHIKGSLCLSASRFEVNYMTIKEKIKKDDLIIAYCNNVNCHLSDIVAGNLKAKGYKNILIFRAGWSEWEEKGYPIEGINVKK